MLIIISGPAASGKNTISQAIAENKENCAVIDVDIVRWMYRVPHKAPWEGAVGKEQQRLGVENACILAKQFLGKNIDVIILDVLQDDTASLYKELLSEHLPKIVLLLPSYEEAYKRFTNRPHTISEDEFKMVYEWQKELTVYDKKIDNTNHSIEETVAEIMA